MILLPNVGVVAGVAMTERIQGTVEKRCLDFGSRQVQQTVSMGVGRAWGWSATSSF